MSSSEPRSSGSFETSGLPTTCVVGAGPSGLAAARVLLSKGLPVKVYERHSEIGGLWDPANSGTPVYESAHFISSKTLSGFPGFPMPEEFPDYPRADQILQYLRSFCRAYGLDKVITTDCGVTLATWTDNGWSVELDNGETKMFDNLICANGTQWHPAMPDIEGTFGGEIYHSKDYSTIDQIRSKRVLVIGAGNSGVDIACDAALASDHAAISMRRGYHFIPKHIFGQPADVFDASGPNLPTGISQRLFAVLLRVLVGKQERLGLPKPDHKLFETHPILNSEIFHYLSHGDLKVHKDVASFGTNTDEAKPGSGIVRFIDGTEDTFDVVICATGYSTPIPYVDESQFDWKMKRPSLLMHLFSRRNPHLFAVGFAEGDGGGFGNFDEMADAAANTIKINGKVGTPISKDWTSFLQSAKPNLTGKVDLIDVPRHASYLSHGPYSKEMARIRERFDWDTWGPENYTTQVNETIHRESRHRESPHHETKGREAADSLGQRGKGAPS